MFFFGSEYFFLLTVTMVTLSAKKKSYFRGSWKFYLFDMKSNNVKDAVLLIFKVDFGLRNEKNISNIFEKG